MYRVSNKKVKKKKTKQKNRNAENSCQKANSSSAKRWQDLPPNLSAVATPHTLASQKKKDEKEMNTTKKLQSETQREGCQKWYAPIFQTTSFEPSPRLSCRRLRNINHKLPGRWELAKRRPDRDAPTCGEVFAQRVYKFCQAPGQRPHSKSPNSTICPNGSLSASPKWSSSSFADHVLKKN